MTRLAVAVVLALALGACATQADRDGERKARSTLLDKEFSRSLAATTCSSLAGIEGLRHDWEKCFSRVEQLAHEVNAAEVAYRAACRKCASAEKCESELRRIRSREGDARKETACPD